MRKECFTLRKEHIEKRMELVKTLQDLYDANQVYCKDRSKLREEIFKTEDEIKKYSKELNVLEKNFKKKDSLLTQYISSLKEKIKEANVESFWELNPSLITETDFEEKLKEALLKETRASYFGEELFEKENVIKQYFSQIDIREKSIQELKLKEVKLKAELQILENNYANDCREYQKIEEEVVLDKSKYEDTIYNRENIINTRVENRNNVLPSYLSKYSSEDFEKYLKVNTNLYKQILRNFTTKSFKAMTSNEKDKFILLVIDDHSIKKNKYYDLIGSLIENDAKYHDTEEVKDSIKDLLCKHTISFSELDKEITSLENELSLLITSKNDLKKKIEKTLKHQVLELHADKKDLQVKYNVNYYFFKVKECSERVDELRGRLEKFEEEYQKNDEEYVKDIDKLTEEDLQIKKQLIELGINKGFQLPDSSESKGGDKYDNTMKKSVSTISSKTISLKRKKASQNFSDTNARSLVGQKNTIDFSATLSKVDKDFNELSCLENLNSAVDDIEIFDSRIPKIVEQVVETNEDPFFIRSVDKILKLIKGIEVYKKVGESSKLHFDMLNSIECPPEKCGFVLRDCLINVRKEQIEIKKGKLVENKLTFDKLKGMILSNHSRALIKYLKTGVKPSLFCVPEADKLIECRYVPIQIMLEKSSVDLILPNYGSFVDFVEAYEELLKLKTKAKRIIRYLEESKKF